MNNLTNKSKWNQTRIGRNSIYSTDKDFPNITNSTNNLIITSNSNNNEISNINNSLILIDEEQTIIPLSKTQEVLDICGEKIQKPINYVTPFTVTSRECLTKKNKVNLIEKVSELWNISVDKLTPMKGGRTSNGIYLIESQDKKFVLKYRGREKEKIELQLDFLNQIPQYFAQNIPRKDNQEFTCEINGEIYGIETFIENNDPKERNLNYMTLTGTHMKIIHEKINSILSKTSKYNKGFYYSDEFANESNMISCYIDLHNSKNKPLELASKMKKLINSDFLSQIEKTPTNLVHKDLNYSNLIWSGSNLIIIDSETLNFAKRINEFVAPLLYQGNMAEPNYLEGSMPTIFKAYNSNNNNPITDSETNILPQILTNTLLRSYTTQSIRKGLDLNPDNVLKNIEKIERDTQ